MDDLDGLLDDDDDFLRMVDTLEHRGHEAAASGHQAVTVAADSSHHFDPAHPTHQPPRPTRAPAVGAGVLPPTLPRGAELAPAVSPVVTRLNSRPDVVGQRQGQESGARLVTGGPGARPAAGNRDNPTAPPASKRTRVSPTKAAGKKPAQSSPMTPLSHGARRGVDTPTLVFSGQRRFPGPAGLLPRLVSTEQLSGGKKGALAVAKSWEIFEGKAQKTDPRMPTDVFDAAKFDSGAWISMAQSMRGFTQFKGGSGVDVNPKNMIATVLRGGVKGKVPMLCVMVKQLKMSDTDASILLVDPSGEMKGTLHRRVFDKYSAEDLAVGAVLVLKQVSVFSPAPRRFYLNITPNNILKHFRPDTPMPERTSPPRSKGSTWTSSPTSSASTPISHPPALTDTTNKTATTSPPFNDDRGPKKTTTAHSIVTENKNTNVTSTDMDAASVEALLEGLDDDIFDD
eukprot:m.430823 g.430823  ORF g.430823 m.430823 type:complete len:455 (-) comp17216_c0_seq1:1486-2850(-)